MHTPGPWKVVQIVRNKRAHIVDLVIFPESGGPVAEIRNASGREIPRADARIIASAPDLLRACVEASQAINEVLRKEASTLSDGASRYLRGAMALLDDAVSEAGVSDDI